MSNLPNEFVLRYARPPSDSIVAQAQSLHQNVRALLGDDNYATLLQGSYKNDTSLWDMNDVDLVAVSRGLVSGTFGSVSPGGGTVSWDEIFARIERKLQGDARYAGKWERKDKCIQLNTGVKIDIVPAVYVTSPESDPVAIYSRREGVERRNWPRNHYDAGAEKSRRTNGAFKQTVRLFKAWRRAVTSDSKVAPSFYIECLLHAVPDGLFSNVGADAFVFVGHAIVAWNCNTNPVVRPGGGDSIFIPTERYAPQFKLFQELLRNSLAYAEEARRAPSEQLAREAWIRAFNGQRPS
ncbi:MAG: hypothetical protein JNK05_31820 [Myxococcales bacterium]|nr:hypothetical protein [Myxococcales bacterium]